MSEKLILKELEDDIRRDRLKAMWQKNSGMIIGLCVAVVIGTSAGVAWKNYQSRQNQQLTGGLISLRAFPAAQLEARRKATQELVKKAGGHAQGALALFALADAEWEAGNRKEALAAYQQVAENSKQDEAIRNLARVMQAHAAIGQASPAPGVASTAGQAFHASLVEAQGWSDYAVGKTPEALQRFRQLAEDGETPAALRERMQAVVAYLAPEGAGEAKEAAQ